MATLREITQSIIKDIKTALDFAGPLASGDPIPDISAYPLDDFPEAGWKAQKAYDMAVNNEEIKEQVQTLIEASDRLSAVYTMLCDLIPARDAKNYDYNTVSVVLPYLTFSLDVLGEIVDELNADLVISDATPVNMKENAIYKRIYVFVVEGLAEYAKRSEKVSGFRVYAIHQLRKFSNGEEADGFEFSLAGDYSTLSCRFDGDQLELSSMINGIAEGGTAWSITISRNGDVHGNMDSDDLDNVKGMRLTIDEPEEYFFYEGNE